MTHKQWTRREALRAAGAAAALPAIIPHSVFGAGGRSGANEQVKIGIIGLGGRARWIVGESPGIPNLRIVAVCDCFAPRCGDFLRTVGKNQKWTAYQDFRKMIETEKLDGVMVETTTHARAWVAVLAMQAGADVYIEKPMCLTVGEGREMVRAARRYKRVTQVGTQQRSMPMNNWASDLVKTDAIGKVQTVLAQNFVGPLRWTKTATKDVKQPVEPWWDVWTNQAELRPHCYDLQYVWSRWRDYDTGGVNFGLTGYGTHAYDQINRALGADDTGPREVILDEPLAIRDVDPARPQVPQTVDNSGPRAKVSMRMASGAVLKFHLDEHHGPSFGAVFIGEKGKIEIGRNKIASNPKELVQSPDNPGPNRRVESSYHIDNWLDCIKTRRRANADIEIGQRATTLCLLINIAREVGRVGQPLQWDPAAERFLNCEEGNRLLSRPRRKAYELPQT
jgi:predicted dehydrogenase